MSRKINQTSPISSPKSGNISKEQDQFLPIANISRIMKRALPANAKISKEAKEKVQECVTEFISFITGEASEKCQREKRKTVNGNDLLWAMTTLGFENYVGPLKLYLKKFMENEGENSHNSNNNNSPIEEDEIDGVVEINKTVSTMKADQFPIFSGGFYYESQAISMNIAISQNVVMGDAYANNGYIP